jgi:LmbE family N-acetylglucosaminyl deacetylase
MLPLTIGTDRKSLRVLCLGAHSDDIEIGCAGTLLRWIDEYEHVEFTWAVLSAAGERVEEARRSAKSLLHGAAAVEIVLGDLEDAHMPADFRRAKAFIADLRCRTEADIVLTHSLDDRHQDHRLIAELTWQSWRNHLILEYEIPKYEGDLGRPNVFVPLAKAIAERKVNHLLEHFGSQRSKDWFSEGTFLGLMHLRGVECRSPSGFAEAFMSRKAVL